MSTRCRLIDEGPTFNNVRVALIVEHNTVIVEVNLWLPLHWRVAVQLLILVVQPFLACKLTCEVFDLYDVLEISR